MQAVELSVVCEGLFFKIFQQPADENTNQGFAVALTSPHSGAGVSRITRSLADALGQAADQFSIAVDGRSLIQGDFEPSEENTSQRPDRDLWQVEKTRENWLGTQANLARALERLRRKYRYVLIDCASMKDAPDALRLAPLVDGIVLVVEANRNRAARRICQPERCVLIESRPSRLTLFPYTTLFRIDAASHRLGEHAGH